MCITWGTCWQEKPARNSSMTSYYLGWITVTPPSCMYQHHICRNSSEFGTAPPVVWFSGVTETASALSCMTSIGYLLNRESSIRWPASFTNVLHSARKTVGNQSSCELLTHLHSTQTASISWASHCLGLRPTVIGPHNMEQPPSQHQTLWNI